jgi:hypothetical protein
MRNETMHRRMMATRLLVAVLLSVAAAVALLMASAPPSWALVSKPAAPTITSPPEGSYDTDGAFVLSGTAQSLTMVEVFEESDGQYRSVGLTWSSYGGSWQLPLSGLADGRYVYKARAKNAWGFSAWSNDRTVTVKALAAPVIEHPGGEVCTRDGSFALGGIAKPNTTVRAADVSATGQLSMLGTATVSPYVGRVDALVKNGRWSMNLSGVSEGTHRYTAQTIETTSTYTILSAWSIPQTVNVTHQELPEWFELLYQDPNAPQYVRADIERRNHQRMTSLYEWSESTGVKIECVPRPYKHGSTIYYY